VVTDILPAAATAAGEPAALARGQVRAAIEPDSGGWQLAVEEGAVGTVAAEHRLVIQLGVTVGGVDLAAASTLVRSTTRTVAETLTAVSGKSTGPWAFEHHELTACFRHEAGLEWQVVVRLADDGFALRYEVPDLQGVSTLDDEATSLSLRGFDRAWVLDYQTWYETPRSGVDVAELATGDFGFPFLLRSIEGRYLLVTESGIDGRFSGAHARVASDAASLRFQQADAQTELARGAVTPWRVFVAGDIAAVVETRLVDELAPPRHPLVGDASWVRPGRAAWSWWSDFYSGAQFEAQKHFVDVAAEFGWEHLLIDCGWEETWVPEIVAYAAEHGIQVHLWTVWHDIDGPEKLAKLALWRSWGVAGIKVDFMESESKDRYRWYDSVLAETARLGLMVNFHGSVIPRGWARTWPHVVGYEAIRGAEYYVFYNDRPLTAGHNVIQPFTRNVVGAMDYTPVAFTAPGRTTSDGHELGLGVVFECGITNFADGVDAYRDRPLAARLLSELPPVWEESRLLAGTPDTEAVLARRSGDRWFIGGIATGPARTITVPLARLGGARHRAWVVADLPGGGGRGLAETDGLVENTLVVDVAADGGFAAVLAPVGTELFRARSAEREESPRVEPRLGTLDPAGRAVVSVDAGASVRVPPGWRAECRDETTWVVTAPEDLAPGSLGVVTVEKPGHRGVPLIGHARLVKPLGSDDVRLSTLPMLAFQNESGPVERDQSNGGGNPRDGGRMRVAEAFFDHGFGVSTPSTFQIFLGGRGDRLTGFVGIDDETPATAAVAIVEADGRELLRVPLTAGTDAVPFDLEVHGAEILTLRTERRPGDEPPAREHAARSPESGAPDAAHIDWASLILTPHHSDAITSRADH
jgi:hypothetical protein